jgi:hypothetical protein
VLNVIKFPGAYVAAHDPNNDAFEPPRHEVFCQSEEPCFWLACYKDDLTEGELVQRLVSTRKEALLALRQRLTNEYAQLGWAFDDAKREKLIATREFLKTATLDQIRAWIEENELDAEIGIGRIQIGMEQWI